MQASTARRSPIAINPQPLLFGAPGESSCGWFASSEALRTGLAIRELSDGELLALWLDCRSGNGSGNGEPALAN